jgi:hypothetical protein
MRWFCRNVIFETSNPEVVSQYSGGHIIQIYRLNDQIVVKNASGDVPAFVRLEWGY